MSWEEQEMYGAPGPDNMFVIQDEDSDIGCQGADCDILYCACNDN